MVGEIAGVKAHGIDQSPRQFKERFGIGAGGIVLQAQDSGRPFGFTSCQDHQQAIGSRFVGDVDRRPPRDIRKHLLDGVGQRRFGRPDQARVPPGCACLHPERRIGANRWGGDHPDHTTQKQHEDREQRRGSSH